MTGAPVPAGTVTGVLATPADVADFRTYLATHETGRSLVRLLLGPTLLHGQDRDRYHSIELDVALGACAAALETVPADQLTDTQHQLLAHGRRHHRYHLLLRQLVADYDTQRTGDEPRLRHPDDACVYVTREQGVTYTFRRTGGHQHLSPYTELDVTVQIPTAWVHAWAASHLDPTP